MTPAQRKKLQRQRDKALGWVEVTLKVPSNRVDELRAIAASFPPPSPPIDPNQLSLIDEIERQIEGGSDTCTGSLI